MADQDTPIARLREQVASFVDERDWRQFHNPKDLAAAINIEGAELQELFLWKTSDEVKAFLNQSAMTQRIKEELADIIIYCLSLANCLEIDVTEAVQSKLAANEAKYPIEKARGTNKKYTEFEGNG